MVMCVLGAVMEPNPLSIILVKSDSKGDRLLFRYPYAADPSNEGAQQSRRRNPYAATVTEDLLQTPPPQTSNICKGRLTGFSDEVLSTLFAVKPELCERKFELKVNDVRFVGHPTSDNIILTNIVFALHATASHSIVKCYYDLSKRLGVALRHEERRCGYLSQETKTMVIAHDEVAARPEEEQGDDSDSPFDLILKRSTLARNLKSVYDDLVSTGLVHVRVNRWIEVSFCLPQKVHQFHKKDFIIEPESIHRCLQSLRPYHGLLLLVEPSELLDHLPPDASPALVRLVRMYSPLKSLQTLAADADLTLSQVFQLAGHLLYWAKATVIYPLCESNVYVIAPDAPTHVNSPLVERFSEHFPGMNLLQVMSDFSLPTSISQKINPLNHPQQQSQLVQIIVWMLQHRLLLQLHTYIYFMPTANGPSLPQPLHNLLPPARSSGPCLIELTPDSINQKAPLQSYLGCSEQTAIRTLLMQLTSVFTKHAFQVHCESLIRQPSHSLKDGSYQSTPDEQLSISIGGMLGGRAPSESDLSSNVSDDVLVIPGNKLNGHPVQISSSLVSTDNEVSFVNALEEEKSSVVQEELLTDFSDEERAAILKISAAANPEDLHLLASLCRQGYLRGNHHLEEIMYLENIRRSQLLQLLDKFRDVLITCETEDPAIAMFYSHSYM